MTRLIGHASLANAFWGAGIKFQKMTPEQLRSAARVLTVFTVVAAVAIGVVVGVLMSAVVGAISSAATLVYMGLIARATLRDYK